RARARDRGARAGRDGRRSGAVPCEPGAEIRQPEPQRRRAYRVRARHGGGAGREEPGRDQPEEGWSDMTVETATADTVLPAPAAHEVDRTGPPLIRAEGVWKIFGPNGERIIGTPDAQLPRRELREKTGCVAAVRDVSFEVWPQEVFVVMGLSGSGKSTLVRTLIRLIEPTAGTIEIDGRDVMAATASELRQLRRHTVSMVFQHFGLLAHRRVIDNVAFGLEVQGMSKAAR